MRKGKGMLLLGVLFMGMLLTACSSKTKEGKIQQGVVFVKAYYHMSNNPKGVFIDNKGNIKKFDFSEVEERIDGNDIIKRLEQVGSDAVISTLPEEELQQNYQALLKINKDSEVKAGQGTEDMDKGVVQYLAMQYKDGEYQSVIISGSGISSFENTDEYAKELDVWMKKVMATDDIPTVIE